MARRPKDAAEQGEPPPDLSSECVWLRACFHAHLFHYRMPETVAIAAVSPLVPSPLTVKMALVAALARVGNIDGARELTRLLPSLKDNAFFLIPPEGAVTFKAFMRYVRPPADPTTRDGNTGGFYAVSPHIREYTLWQGNLAVVLRCPVEAKDLMTEALWNVAYLGAKDSQVTCLSVEVLPDGPPPTDAVQLVTGAEGLEQAAGPIFRLADFAPDRAPTLEQLIPFSRDKKDYRLGFYALPGTLEGSGRAKIYRRKGTADAPRDGSAA